MKKNPGRSARRILCCWSILLIAGTALGDTRPEQVVKPEKNQLNIGLPKTLFRGIPDELLRMANKPFMAIMLDQTGTPGNVINPHDAMTMAKLLNEKELQLGVFQGFEFAWAQARYPELEPLVMAVPHVKETQVYLVVGVHSKIQKPSDLKDKCIGLPADCKDHVLVYWDKVLNAEVGGSRCCKSRKSMSSKEALHEVVDGEIDATLVDSAAFLSFQSDSPGRAKKLLILKKSDIFPPTVIAYRKGAIEAKLLKKCQDGLCGAKQNPSAKFMLNMIKLTGFENIPENYSQQLKKSMQLYPDSAIDRISFEKLIDK